jgi:hypothetical protein
VGILLGAKLTCEVCGFEGTGRAKLGDDFAIISIDVPRGWLVDSEGLAWCSQRCVAKRVLDTTGK